MPAIRSILKKGGIPTKRKYEKPYLAVESFQLDAAIAGSCSGASMQAINQQINACMLGDNAGETPDYLFGNSCRLDYSIKNTDICYQAMEGAYLES